MEFSGVSWHDRQLLSLVIVSHQNPPLERLIREVQVLLLMSAPVLKSVSSEDSNRMRALGSLILKSFEGCEKRGIILIS